MDNIAVAQKIRHRRKQLSLTQKDLANGICTQAQISNIEKGELSPSGLILYKISEKLQVDMNFFFNMEPPGESEEAISVKNLMRKYVRQRDYQSLYYITSNESDNPVFQTKENQQFLHWHQSICKYYLKKSSFKQTIKDLDFSLKLTQIDLENYSEREIEILNSKAIIYTEEKEYDEAIKTYKKCLDYIDLLPLLSDRNIKIRILYGLSKCLTDMKKFEESISYCKLGEKLCIENETLYLLGELIYQIGNNLVKSNIRNTGIEYLDKAITVFEIQKKYSFIEIINQEKENLVLEK